MRAILLLPLLSLLTVDGGPRLPDGGVDAGADGGRDAGPPPNPITLNQIVANTNAGINSAIGHFMLMAEGGDLPMYSLLFVTPNAEDGGDLGGGTFYQRTLPGGFVVVGEGVNESNCQKKMNDFLGRSWRVYR